MTGATIWLLWSLYTGSQTLLGHYATEAECKAAIAAVKAQIPPAKPNLVCLQSRKW